ncbi:MAG: DUF4157 domain-containing protein [Gammaproteobacteria bacterium]|nr:DUF4157 domain-containing protein [Gammaproteobacteria bacterium]
MSVAERCSSGTQRQSRRSKRQSLSFRQQQLESQAQFAADNFTANNRQTRVHFSQAPAASIPVTNSRSEALPKALQDSLEQAYDTDLSAIRIHRDQAALELTRDLNARAFAAGSHLFFAPHLYQPHSLSGQNLIAHEVAHAIQQTARSSSVSPYSQSVTDISGSGIAQCSELPLTSTESVADVAELLQNILDLVPADFATDQAQAIAQLIQGHRNAEQQNSVEAFWQEREQYFVSETNDPLFGIAYQDLIALPFVMVALFDAFKKQQRFDAAIKIFTIAPSIRTQFYSAEFYRAFSASQANSDNPFAYHDLIWNATEFFAPTRYERMYDTVRSYFLGPTRAIPNLGGSPRFQDAAGAFLALKDAPEGVIENEIFFATVWAVRKVDRIRINKLSELARTAAEDTPASQLTLRERYLVALGFENWIAQYDQTTPAESDTDLNPVEALAQQAETRDDVEDLTPETLHILQALAPFWHMVASSSAQLIAEIFLLEERRRGGRNLANGVSAGDFISAVVNQDELADFKVVMVTQLQRVLALNNGFVPPANTYRDRVGHAKTQIRTALHSELETPVFRVVKRLQNNQTVSSEERDLMFVRMWLMLRVSDFIEVLDLYSYDDDRAFEGQYRERDDQGAFTGAGREDIRIAHRFEVASWIYGFGNATNWGELAELGLAIRTATQEGQTESHIALIGDWVEDTSVSIGQIRDDFSSGLVINDWAPLTAGDLANFFQARYFEGLRGHLDQLVSDRYLDYDRPLIREAKSLAHEHEGRPRKYIIEGQRYYAALKDEDRGHLDELYGSHPKTQMFIAELNFPVRVSSRQDIFFWTFPALDQVVAILQNVAEFQQLISRHEAFQTAQPAQVLEMDGMHIEVNDSAPEVESEAAEPETPPEWLLWLEKLNDALTWWQSLSEDEKDSSFDRQLTAQVRAFHGGLRDDLDQRYDEMLAAERRASIYERQAFVNSYVRPNLAAYDRFNHFSEGPRGGLIYGIPSQVLSDISELASRTQPSDDQGAHLAVAFLQISDVILERFANNQRFDIYAGYKHVLDQVIEHLDHYGDDITQFLAPNERSNSDWVSTRRANIEEQIARFEQFTLDLQMQFGFGGNVENGNELLFGLDQGFTISTQEPAEGESPIGGPNFVIDGIQYRLLDVFHNFVYHPPVGDSQGILIVDGEQVRPYQEGQSAPAEPRVLFQISINGMAHDITEATNDDLLKTLSQAITMEAINRNLQNLGEIIETFNEVLMEGVEFVPGAGQAVLIARIGMSIIQMINSGELDDIKELLFSNPQELFENLQIRIEDAMRPETLWKFLLFNNGPFLGNFAGNDEDEERRRRRRPSRRRGVSAKLRRITATLAGLGRSFAISVSSLQDKMRRPTRSLQYAVLSTPLLGFFLQQMDRYLPILSELSLSDITDAIEGVDNAMTTIQQFPDKVTEMAQTFNEMELPDEIFNMEDILEIVLELVVDRLPAKAEYPIRFLLVLLEVGDMKGRILRTIGDWIGEVADPNDYWRSARDEYIDPLFQDARDEFVNRVYGTMNAIRGINFTNPLSGLGDFTPQNAPLAEPEMEGYDGQMERPLNQHFQQQSSSLGHVSSGNKLNPRTRLSVERAFGHDFSHVRLHQGSEGDRMTQRFNAQGITSGSHIFLPNTLNIASNSGQHILHHELTHVLQQTGRRPLGSINPNTPTLGRHRRGFNFNSARENAAEQVAKQTVSSPVARRPIDPGSGEAAGLQPRMQDAFLSDFFRFLTSYQSLQEYSNESIDRARAIALDPEVRNQTRYVARDIRAMVSDSGELQVDARFSSVRALIKQRLAGQFRGGDFTQAVVAIAKNAQREERSSGSSQSDPEKYLHLRSFSLGLKQWIFANTGIEVNIRLNRKESAPTELDPDSPISAMHADAIFLPGIPVAGSGRELWTEVIDNTFPRANDDRSKRVYRAQARLYLNSRGPTFNPFQSGITTGTPTFRFKTSVKNDIDALVDAATAASSDFDANFLPPVSYYTNTSDDTTPNPVNASMGITRLRLGLHGDGSQRAVDRESHHLPQYLLIEYFANLKSEKPFQHINVLNDYGLDASSSIANSFTNTSGTSLAISSLKGSGRGSNMPSILLARVTHQRAGLHVVGEADEAGGRPTQGIAIHNYFKNQIKSKVSEDFRNKMFGNSAAELRAMFEESPQAATNLQNKIYESMRQTYSWMSVHMLDKLREGLINNELDYYNTMMQVSNNSQVSNQDGEPAPGYRLRDTDLLGVFNTAEQHFERVMSSSGNNWTLPTGS